MKKLAVVLFNLGGPDSPDAVEPFLRNLFSDPAIIRAPGPVRWMLARSISRKRAPIARKIYEHLGGASPLLRNTEAQAQGLKAHMDTRLGVDWVSKVFVAMRYWHPFASEIVEKVKEFQPDEIVLLPLYPQFSTTTSQSSLDDWEKAARKAGLNIPTRSLCCYPSETGFVNATARLLGEGIEQMISDCPAVPRRILFSAHGLPEKIVNAGDPYPLHVEQSAKAVADLLEPVYGPLDYTVCYQSRVGPLKWIGPDTEEEIKRAGKDGVAVILVPIAFVSEHSETLVELDIEYRDLSREEMVPGYYRVPTVGASPEFLDGLACLVIDSGDRGRALCSQQGGRLCPSDRKGCRTRP